MLAIGFEDAVVALVHSTGDGLLEMAECAGERWGVIIARAFLGWLRGLCCRCLRILNQSQTSVW